MQYTRRRNGKENIVHHKLFIILTYFIICLVHIGFSDDHDLSEKKLTLRNLKQISEEMLVDLNKMRDSKNIHILYQTIQRLKKISMQEVDVKVWPQLRRFQAELWFCVLDIIEKEINRNYDINKQPSINVSPPGPYPSGIAPEAIKEPELRKEYEKAIEENSRKIKEHKYQSMLRQMEVEFPKKLQTLLIWFYARDPDAIEELKRLFEKYKTNKKLSVEILKVVKEERIRNKSKEDLHLRKDAVKEMERQAQKELRLVKEIAKAEREKMDIEMQLKRMRAEMIKEVYRESKK